jgi:hypothetical protein
MKRLLTISLITLSLIAGGTAFAPLVHADARDTNNSNVVGGGSGVNDANTTRTYSDPFAQSATDAKAAAQNSTSELGSSSDDSYNTIMAKIMSLFAWLVGVAALTLDYAVYYTVINMGAYVHSLTAIGITWRVLRDVGNIMLIFGFLAIGLSIILNTERLGYGKKMLPMLLVAAIFLNFSLFFAEAIIDTGNLFATQFYTQINGGTPPSPAFLQNLTIKNEGISNKIMAQLGLTTIYGDAQNPDKAKTVLKGQNPWLIGFMGILLFIVTAFVFFALAFILVARFVALLFLIILAPIGFAGLAVPQLAGRAKQWWDALFQQTITAPVLMLMLYVALVVITDASFLSGTGNGQNPNWLGSINGNLTGFGAILLTFLIAMGLLIAVIIMAKSLSAFGAGAVSKVGSAAKDKLIKTGMAPVRFAGRAASNTGRWAVRSTAGRTLNWAANRVRTSAGGQSQVGRIVAQTLDKGGKGFKDAKEKNIKKHEEYVKSVQTAIEEKHAPAAFDLQRARLEQEDRVKTTKAEQEEIVKATRPLFDEVERLEKLVAENRNSGRVDPAAVAALAEARRKAAPAEAQRQAADLKLKAAGTAFKSAKAEEEEFNNAVSNKKKEATIAYGENLQASFTNNPLTWIASGQSSNAAALKIIKGALATKKTQDKFLEEAKKLAKEMEEEGGKKDDGKGGEESPAKGGH